MAAEMGREIRWLLDCQDGVIAVGQVAAAGMSPKAARGQVRAGRWQVMHRGVYAAFTGPPGRRAELWAALLRAGPGAVLSHQSAAELWGMANGPGSVIHVTVPHKSSPDRCGKIPGVVIHRSRSLDRARHPALAPPRTRVEETVLDLIDGARSFDEAYDWICRAVGRRRTTAARLHAALAARSRVRCRMQVELALGYAAGGALSGLEYRYVRGVERPHGLPMASRQARVKQATGNRYLDNLYVAYRACVEIDGTAAHPEDEQWRDKGRDRWNAVHEGIETIRIGVPDLISKERQCRTAADVTKWLSGRGPAVGRPCGPGCPVSLLGGVRTTYGRKVHPVFFGSGWCGSGGAWVVRVSALGSGGRLRGLRFARPCQVGWLRGLGFGGLVAGGHGVKIGLGWCGWRGLGCVAEVGAFAGEVRRFPFGWRWSPRKKVGGGRGARGRGGLRRRGGGQGRQGRAGAGRGSRGRRDDKLTRLTLATGKGNVCPERWPGSGQP